MKKILPLLLITSLILSSCGTEAVVTAPLAKIPFAVTAQSLSSFSKSYTISKTGRLVGSSSITLTSQ